MTDSRDLTTDQVEEALRAVGSTQPYREFEGRENATARQIVNHSEAEALGRRCPTRTKRCMG